MSRRDRTFSALLFLLALVPRLYVALAWPREPVWDGHYYDFGARRIAAGLGYSDDVVIGGMTVWHPWCHYPVGYSGFLGFFYWLFGAGTRTGPVVNAVIGALTVVLVHRLALGVTSVTRARAAGALTAVHPGLILYTALLMTEPLAGFGLLLAAWLFRRDRENPVRAGVMAGVVLGLSTLVRPPSLLLAPALLFLTRPEEAGAGEGWSWVRAWARRLVGPAVAVGMAVFTVLPWTLRNCRVMDGCAFVSTNAGWNLMIGAFPRATGRFETVRATDGCPVVTGQVQQDRCWGEAGMAHIRQDPARWLSLAPKKLGYTFDHESFPIGYLGEANPRDWPEARKEMGRGVLTVFHRGLLVFAALAAVPWPRLLVPLIRGLALFVTGSGGTRAAGSAAGVWGECPKETEGTAGRASGRSREARSGAKLRAAVAGREALSWAALLGVIALALWGFFADGHPSWPLALAVALLPAVPFFGARRRGILGYLAFLVGTVAAVSVVFFGEDRYHMVASPALCLLAACALQWRPAGDQPATSQ